MESIKKRIKKKIGGVERKDNYGMKPPKAPTPQMIVRYTELLKGIKAESSKMQAELLKAWNNLTTYPIVEKVEVNEHAGLEVAGEFTKQTGVNYYLIQNSSKVKDVFRKSGAKDALPTTGKVMYFQNYFRTSTPQFLPLISLKNGGGCIAFTIVVNKEGQYTMVNVFIPIESKDNTGSIIEFIINEVI